MDQALFVNDIFVKNSLFGITIRSQAARGRLKGIQFPRLPTVYTPIKAEDIPGKNQLDGFPVPVLESETVSYIGEPVALLIGPDKAKLEEFAARCKGAIE